MRFVIYILFLFVLLYIAERAVSLLFKGELFKPGAFKSSFGALGKDIWLGARMFVVVWLLYLVFIWWVRSRA